jgi:hypothetical protein
VTRASVVVLIIAALGCTKKSETPPAETLQKCIVGKHRAASNETIKTFVSVDVRADGTVIGDDGSECKHAPCHTEHDGKWTISDDKLVVTTDMGIQRYAVEKRGTKCGLQGYDRD